MPAPECSRRGRLDIPAPVEWHEQESIGPYRLMRRIGQGGMGEVWLAEQTEPLQRRVALKLIRTGFFDGSLLQRFQSERQSLAVMEHPAIAKVFDAGMTDAGQPYLVMEYVDGEPITRYCDRKRLTIRERLDLFAEVCDGVQHAHQKAILHRDLKPANILVVEIDGQPAPRIIDFGLASVIGPGAEQGEGANAAESLAGTPGYMSPEQLAGVDLDTRTDVYSLGVVLYELLTGALPVDTGGWREETLSQLASRVREQPVIPPSRRVASGGSEAAQARRCTQRKLASQLSGDLDLITGKALRIGPESPLWHSFGTGRRYPALPSVPARRGACSQHPLLAQEVSPAPSRGSGDGGAADAGAGRSGRAAKRWRCGAWRANAIAPPASRISW